MSNKTTKSSVPTASITKVPFYRRASFPWAIIVLTATLAAGAALGWTLRSEQVGQVQAEAQAIVAELKENQ